MITRRKFIYLGIMGLVGSVFGSSCEINPKTKAKKTLSRRYGMLIDLPRCLGCHSCTQACKREHHLPLGVWRSHVKIIAKGERIFPLPLLCNHCQNPPCVSVCPTQASYINEDGVVLMHKEICVGCKYCLFACPYNARFIHPLLKVIDKCTFCIHRVYRRLPPACVEACPVKIRIFGDLQDKDSLISSLIKRKAVSVLREELNTKPSVFYVRLDGGLQDYL